MKCLPCQKNYADVCVIVIKHLTLGGLGKSLGLSRATVWNRMVGKVRITEEAVWALTALSMRVPSVKSFGNPVCEACGKVTLKLKERSSP